MTDAEKIKQLEEKVYELNREVERLKNLYESNRYDEYEYDEDFDDDDWEWSMEDDDYSEELAGRAAMCTCGAWVFGKDGKVYHVADCYCGAE